MSRIKSSATTKVPAKPAKAKTKANAAMRPSFEREHALMKQGVWPVAGCDEVGRGPLAGPVVAAAVILDPDRIPKGIDDSKRLTMEAREALFDEICATALVSVAAAPPWRIDRDNILRASLWALARAVRGLPQAPRHVFVDGRDRIDVPCGCEPVIGGDGLLLSIGAASIVAKVTRDRLMCRLAQAHPEYGFDSHMGYGVPRHLEALRQHGPTPHHRRHFAPVAAAHARLNGVAVPADLSLPEVTETVIAAEEAAVQVA
ncbi:ribonuclease HII [[Pseudomonas] carboxydohydrogena]|nr:ribonuclease HII [[Pseudomonas] carboxydohydrogena]